MEPGLDDIDDDKGIGARGIIAGGVLGAAAGGVVYNHLANEALMPRNYLDPHTSIGKKYAEAMKREGATSEQVLKELSNQKALDRAKALNPEKYAEIQKNSGKVRRFSKYGVALCALLEKGIPIPLHYPINPQMLEGMSELSEEAKNSTVVFEQVGRKFTMHIHLPVDYKNMTSDELKELEPFGIINGAVKIEGLKELPNGITIDPVSKMSAPIANESLTALRKSKGKSGRPWIFDAIGDICKSEQRALEKESVKVMRKAGGFGWSWGNLTGFGKLGVIGATVAGIGTGVMLLGRKHAHEVEAQRENSATQPTR